VPIGTVSETYGVTWISIAVSFLRGDGSIEYARILDAVDAARSAGVRRIGIITEPVRPQDTDESSRPERN
jgi:hypothetical protein